jgi:hypothetical protein
MTVAGSPDETTARARARLQGKRVALVVVIAVAVVFIGASSMQIVPAVFGAQITPLPLAPPGSGARACADGVRALLRELDSQPPAPPADEEWDRTARSCRESPEGLDAWAALLRLRSAVRPTTDPRMGRAELAPLRRDVAAHLPPDLR